MKTENIEKLAPKLRFSEFNDEWKKINLSDISTDKNAIIAGPFGSNLKVEDYKDNGKPLIRLQNIERSKFLIKDIKFVSDEKAEELQHHSFKPGDVVFSKLGNPIGKTCRVPLNFPEGIVVADVVRIMPDENSFNPDFLVEVLNTRKIENQIKKETIGSTRTRLNLTQVRALQIGIPSINEQNKIMGFLSKINKKLRLLEEKLLNYQNFKKYLMQQIFGQKLRFDNSSVIQKEIHLGDVISIINKRNKDNEKLPVLSISNKFGFISQTEQFEDREVASSDKKNYKIVNNGEFAYNPARINVGSIAQLKNFDIGIISPMYIVFNIDSNKLEPIFFENFLDSDYFRHEMEKRLEGSVRMILSAESLKNIKMTVPSIEEQKKMSELFLTFDKKIDITKHQL